MGLGEEKGLGRGQTLDSKHGGIVTNQQQQVTGNPLDQLREAQEVFLRVLANVRPEQMSLPTPDDEWDVRALINHVVLGYTQCAPR